MMSTTAACERRAQIEAFLDDLHHTIGDVVDEV